MRNVRGELAAQALVLFLFGNVQQHDHRALHAVIVRNGVRDEAVTAPRQLCDALARRTRQRGIHCITEIGAAVKRQHALWAVVLRVHVQKAHSARVVRKHIALCIHHNKALAHVFGDGGKLRLLAVQLFHFLLDGLVLALQAQKQRRKLAVHVVFHRVVKVNGVDRRHNLLCAVCGKQNGQHQNNDGAQQHPRHHALNGAEHRLHTDRKAQHASVREHHSVVIRLHIQRIGFTHGFPRTVFSCSNDLRAVVVVFHVCGICNTVKSHRAVRIDDGHAHRLRGGCIIPGGADVGKIIVPAKGDAVLNVAAFRYGRLFHDFQRIVVRNDAGKHHRK